MLLSRTIVGHLRTSSSLLKVNVQGLLKNLFHRDFDPISYPYLNLSTLSVPSRLLSTPPTTPTPPSYSINFPDSSSFFHTCVRYTPLVAQERKWRLKKETLKSFPES